MGMPTRTGPLSGQAGDGHDAAESLGDLVDAGAVRRRGRSWPKPEMLP